MSTGISKQEADTVNTYKWLISQISNIAYICNRNGNILFVSEAYEKLTNHKPDELIGKPFNSLFDDDNLRKVMDAHKKVLGGECPMFELDFRDTGSLCECRNIPLRDETQNIIGVIGIARDITEQAKAEKELKKFKFLSDNSNDAHFLLERDARFQYVNETACKLMGYTKNELLTLGVPDVDIVYDVSKFHELFDLIQREKVPPIETVNRKKDGTLFPAEITVSGYQIDGRQYMFAALRNITDRKKDEERLRESEKRFRDISENTLEWIWEVDLKGKYVYSNPVVEKILGYTPEEILEKHFYDLIHPDDREELKKAAFNVFETRQSFREFLNRNIHKNGDIVWLSTSGIPILDRDGTLLGYRGADTDITERRKGEEELKRLNRELKHKNRELEQIVYITSHDLRTPLVNIQGFGKELGFSVNKLASFLQSGLVPEDIRAKAASIIKDDIPEALKYISTSVLKMDNLLSGLLTVSRLGRSRLKKDPVDMNRLISDITGIFEFQIKTAGIKLEISELPPCIGDKDHINQAFSNLISNALKFLDPDRPGLIRISGYRDNGQSVYCVEDNSIGIAPEYHGKIFEIFHRLEPGKSKGEGLGLTIANMAVERQNGRIWVESEPGRGSRFYVALPGISNRK